MNHLAVHRRLHAAALDGGEVADDGQRQLALGGSLTHGAGNQVFGVALDRRGKSQGIVFLPCLCSHHPYHTELALRQRAGLIEDDHIDVTRGLQRQSIADQDAVAGAQRRGDGHYERHSQPKRMRAGDHQDGDHTFQTTSRLNPIATIHAIAVMPATATAM